jgi:hypothetical protein
VTLVHEEVICKDIKGHAREVHLIETSGLVPSISNEAFITPGKTKSDKKNKAFTQI